MRKFEIVERYVGMSGEICEPQILEYNEEEGFYTIEYINGIGGCAVYGWDLDRIIEAGATWLREVKPERWKAGQHNCYYYINTCGTVFECSHMFSEDNDNYSVGNYFKTREQAQVVADKIKALLKEEQDKLLIKD
jgi:hypothetical protein